MCREWVRLERKWREWIQSRRKISREASKTFLVVESPPEKRNEDLFYPIHAIQNSLLDYRAGGG